jgi:uncharacterized protein (DUF983 family)
MNVEPKRADPTPLRPLAALVRARCPRCRSGRIFGPLFAMNERCPVCGLVFQAEPGYFSAAWGISFFIGFPVVLILTMALASLVLPDWPLPLVVIPAVLLYSLFVPLVWICSRVLLIHVDKSRQRE